MIKAGNPLSIAPRAHCHNDILSIEIWMNGVPVIIDPGTFCYTSDIDKRNHFRSNKMHNSVTINKEEINPLNKNVFYVDWKTNFTCENWSISSDKIRFVGKHDAFEDRFGVIIRTVEKNKTVSELEGDLKDLILRWKRLCINFSKADSYPTKILGEVNNF